MPISAIETQRVMSVNLSPDFIFRVVSPDNFGILTPQLENLKA